MASLKELIDAYKAVNSGFRHEFNGETWHVWFSRDNGTGGYPDMTSVDTGLFRRKLVEKLREHSAHQARVARLAAAEVAKVGELLTGEE